RSRLPRCSRRAHRLRAYTCQPATPTSIACWPSAGETPGSQTVSDPGSQTVSDPGSQTVSDPGSQTVSDPGSQTVSDPGSQTVSDPRSPTVSAPPSHPGSDPRLAYRPRPHLADRLPPPSRRPSPTPVSQTVCDTLSSMVPTRRLSATIPARALHDRQDRPGLRDARRRLPLQREFLVRQRDRAHGTVRRLPLGASRTEREV